MERPNAIVITDYEVEELWATKLDQFYSQERSSEDGRLSPQLLLDLTGLVFEKT